MDTDFNRNTVYRFFVLGLLCLLVWIPVQAQRPVEVIPMIMPPYPNEFHEFEEDFDTYTITIINYTFEDRELYFHVALIGDNGISAQSNTAYRPLEPFVIGPRETYMMTGAEFRELNRNFSQADFTYEGISELQLALGVLPEGNYELCIQAFDFQSGDQLTVGCSFSFPAGNGDVPRIIYPFEGDVISETLESFPITWEAPTSNPLQAMDFVYIVKLVDLSLYGDHDYEDVFLDGGVAVTLEEGIEGMTSVFYNDEGDDPPLVFGHMYGLRVQVTDPTGTLTFENNGYSEIRTFYFGDTQMTEEESTQTEDQLADLPDDCESRCNLPDVVLQMPVTDLTHISSLRIGHFYVQNYTLSPAGDGWLGEGEIVLNFLNEIRIRVTLSGLQINEMGEIYGGVVRGIQEEGTMAEFLQYVTFPVGNEQMGIIADVLPAEVSAEIGSYLRDARMIAALAGYGQIGLPVGFSQAISGFEFTVGITDLLLTPSSAKAKLVAGARLPMFEGENWLMFVADSVCIHPAGFGGEYQLSLGADLVLNNGSGNAYELRLNGSTVIGETACSLEMDCQGIRAVNMHGMLEFARNVIVPETEEGLPADEGKAAARFSFNGVSTPSNPDEADASDVSGIHWLASLEMDRFQIPGLNGWSFEVTDGWLDMSEIANPDDIVFPLQYETTGPDFTGVYIGRATIQPPAAMCKGPRPYAEVAHLIMDPNLYGNLVIENLLRLSDGEIGGWAWSIESFTLEVYNNELIESRLEGAFHMPLLDTASHIRYFALIGQGETGENQVPGGESYSYQFNVSFSDQVRYSFLIAEGEIYDDSVLDIVFHPEDASQSYVHAVLHGVLSIDTDQFLPANFPELPASIKMPQIEYAFDFHSQSGFNPDGTYISFASPSKFLSGFPVNMDNFEVNLSTTSEHEIAFDFNVAISFAEGEADLAAGVQFSLISNLTTVELVQDMAGPGALGGTVQTLRSFRLQQVRFDSILLDVQVSALILQGAIGFYNEPLGNGGRNKGVRGDINVVLPIGPNGITGRLTAIFGTTGIPAPSYSESFYSYWFVEGIVGFPVGIQFGAIPLGLYGIGGGVGYNMIQTASPQVINGEISGESVFEPVYQSFRLSIKAMLGTMPKPDAFNADIAFIAQFVNGGLDMIGIEGDGYIMTPMSDRDDPQVYVGCDLYMYMPNESRPWSIEGGLDVAVNVGDGILVGNMSPAEIPNQMVAASFHASPDLFYFHMGAPDFNLHDNEDPRGSAMLDLQFLQVQAKTYLMLGHGIPTALPPLPLPIQNMLNNPLGELDGTTSATSAQSGFDASQVESATGLAHGTYVELTADIDAFLLYATLAVYLGYDMNITERSTQCINTGAIIGINGWYAEGQAYAGIEGGLGIRFKLMGKERDIKLFDLAAAIALYGGAPKPFYFGGQASVQYSVLNGLVEGSSSFAFSVGERCTPALNDPLAGIDFFEHIAPGQEERTVFVGAPMHIKLTLPVLQDIVIPQPIEDANGVIIGQELLRYRPEMTWNLRRQGQSQNIALQNPVWTDTEVREQVYLLAQQILDPTTWYELRLQIKAWDYQEGRFLRVDDKEWTQDTLVRFRTGQLPHDLYSFVTHTVPLPMERFFLQGESGNGLIYFPQALDAGHYFPVADAYGSGYTYYVRLTNLESRTDQEIPFTYHSNISSGSHYLRFNLPSLDHQMIYALQVIRKSSAQAQLVSRVGRVQRSIASLSTQEGISTDLTVNTEALIPPGEQLTPGEFLLYHTYFRTSAFNTLREKMQAASQGAVTYTPNPSAMYGKKARLNMTLAEAFETRDFHPFHPSATYPFMRFLPRIRLLDLFSTNYHDQHAERRILKYKEYYQGTVQGYPFTRSWPATSEFEWNHPQIYRLAAGRVDATLRSPLQQSEVEALWMSGSNNSSASAWAGGDSGGRESGVSLASTLACTITFDTHFKVSKDRKTVLDWAASYMASYAPGWIPQPYENLFQQQHPGFINRYNQLLNDDLRLENYEGTYSLQFGRNIATRAEEEVINIFSLHALPFSTPGAGILQNSPLNPMTQWTFSR